MKDPQDRTFDAYVLRDLGIFIGPSGLKRGPTGPWIRVLLFLLMKDLGDRTFGVYVLIDLLIFIGPSGLKRRPTGTGPFICFVEMHDQTDGFNKCIARTFRIGPY